MALRELALTTRLRPIASDSIIMISVVKGNVATFTPATCVIQEITASMIALRNQVIDRKLFQNRGLGAPLPGLF